MRAKEWVAGPPSAGDETVVPSRTARSRPSPLRMSAFEVFVGAFMLLMGSVTALILGQLKASHAAPYVSIVLSGAAVLATVASLLMKDRS